MDEAQEIRLRLSAALDSGSLAKGAAETASALKARLDAPVRVTLLGLAGSGRRRLANMIAGESVLPLDRPLPTFSLRRGRPAETTVTLPSGQERAFAGLPIEEILARNPVFLDIALPLEGLRDFTLLDIAAEDVADDLLAGMAWAAPKTDIALWMSRRFSAFEAEVWARAPERMKDHAYLVMTELPLPETSAEGFRARFTVSPGSTAAPGLMSELKRCAAQGRQLMLDHALLFLNRFEPRRSNQPRNNSKIVDLAEERSRSRMLGGSDGATSQTRPITTPLTRPLTKPLTKPMARPQSRPTTAPLTQRRIQTSPTAASRPLTMPSGTSQGAAGAQKPARPSTAQQTGPVLVPLASPGRQPAASRTSRVVTRTTTRTLEISPIIMRIESRAIGYLRGRADELEALINKDLPSPLEERVLKFCLETIEALVEQVGAASASEAGAGAVEDMVLEAADLMMLLQAESGLRPATDAITLLLQLRRDLEVRHAA